MPSPTHRKRRRDDDEDAPLSITAPDVEDDDEDDEDGPEVDVDEGVRHARDYRGRRSAEDDDDEDAGDDQTIPDRVVRLPLPKPWNQLRIWAWLDYPEEVAVLFGPKRADETDDDAGERIMDGLRTVITRHDGWRDRDGKLPQPSSRTFWRRVSTPLSRAIMEAFFAMIRRNPTPRASQKRKRKP